MLKYVLNIFQICYLLKSKFIIHVENLSLRKEGHFLVLDHSGQCFYYEDALRPQESVSQETW